MYLKWFISTALPLRFTSFVGDVCLVSLNLEISELHITTHHIISTDHITTAPPSQPSSRTCSFVSFPEVLRERSSCKVLRSVENVKPDRRHLETVGHYSDCKILGTNVDSSTDDRFCS